MLATALGLLLRKRLRLGFRLVIAGFDMLAAGGGSQFAGALISTVTGLVVLTLIVELWANNRCHETCPQRSKFCHCVGRCGKKDLRAPMVEGAEVDMDRLVCENTKKKGIKLGPST